MAKVDPKSAGWDQPPLPLGPRGERGEGRPVRQFSLIHIMILVVYFAVLSWGFKQVLGVGGYASWIVLGVLVGLGICGLGLWAALTLVRFSAIGWILFVIGYVIVTGVTTSGLGLFSLPLLIGCIVFLGFRRHANNQDGLLWVLQVAAERGMPLAPGVEAFSGQVGGMYRVWAGVLADLLRRGVPLPEALATLPRLVTGRSALFIRMGWESGNLPLGLREAGSSRESSQPVVHAVLGRMAYLGWVGAIGTCLVGFLLYFVIPRFRAIFQSFDIALPAATALVAEGSEFVIDYSWIVLLVSLAAFVYVVVALLGPADLGLPVFDRLFARRHAILILRSLAIVVAAGRPIAPAFFALAQWYPTAWVRKRLAQAARDAGQGFDWCVCLRENGLISASDVGVLASAQRAGNLSWAFRELAVTGERRWAYRLQAWSQLLFVATMLVFGSLVFLLAIAFFLPLITIIERLAS